jgi:hypothetical protein
MKQHEINRHKNMSIQLGMPRGTAANRLRKLILFDVLQRHKENICYRCGLEITSADELSIEHKQPWEHVDVKLFWDLKNISFSHLGCNCAAARRNPFRNGGIARRNIAPDGMSWCRTHKKFLPVEEFCKKSGRWNGLCHDCRECEKKYKDFYRYGKISEDGEQGAQPVSNTGPTLAG